MFFGAGGLFFKKPLAQYNICNDLNSDVYNVFQILIEDDIQPLLDLIEITPFGIDTFKYLKQQEYMDKYLKALRFLYLSNYSLYGSMNTIRISVSNSKKY